MLVDEKQAKREKDRKKTSRGVIEKCDGNDDDDDDDI